MANETKLSSLINPEVMADMIEQKLVNAMKFTPLCKVDSTLVGRAGDTVTLPQFAYIGDAETVGELQPITIKELTSSSQGVKVTKTGIGVELSDEAVLSGYGDPIGEAANQIITSIASKLDNDILASLDLATLIHPVVSVSANEINNALIKFGEDYDGTKYLFVSPETYAALRDAKEWVPASEIAAGIVLRGVVGMIYGCAVIVSNKVVGTNVAYIVKPEAVALFLKRGTFVEDARNIINKSTTITADKHYATYLYDASKVIKLGAATLAALTVKQKASIADGKARFTVEGFPTNLAHGWKAFYATGLAAALSVAVGDEFENGVGDTHADFANEYVGDEPITAANGKYFQVIYIDAANKVRATGNVLIATTIA